MQTRGSFAATTTLWICSKSTWGGRGCCNRSVSRRRKMKPCKQLVKGLAVLAFGGLALASDPPKKALVADLQKATALLYMQSDIGAMTMVCTATAFEKVNGGYRFLTAAHCTAECDVDKEIVRVNSESFYITTDSNDEKDFIPAKVIYAGYRPRGDDFS